MKVALIGDVHANLPALEAVLGHADRQGARMYWDIGDQVGYNAYPDACVRRLRQAGAVSVAGNYDRKVLAAPRKAWRRKRAEKVLAFRWAHQQLSPASRAHLASLPRQRRLEAVGRKVLLTHGSPAAIDEYLEPTTPDQRLRDLAAQAAADIVVCGHSHRPFARRVEKCWFINTGSVGRPDDGDPRASYALLELRPHLVRICHFRVVYDVARAASEIRHQGLPESFALMIEQGLHLDRIRPLVGVAGTSEVAGTTSEVAGTMEQRR